MESSLSLELDILTSLVFTANACNNFEKAFGYNKELHRLNQAIDPNHPNTMNSCITSIKLVMKLARSISPTEQLSFKNERMTELVDILTFNCHRFSNSDSEGDGTSTLFKSFLFCQSTNALLN